MQPYPYPATTVARISFDEWIFRLGPGHEVLIGYSIKINGVWELFGNDSWVWFTGALESLDGAAQIVAQWAERENTMPRDRVWQWVHWRNPSQARATIRPFVLLSPGATVSDLNQGRETRVQRHIWTIADMTDDSVIAIVTRLDPADDDEAEGKGMQAAVAVRPLGTQRLASHQLEGDTRFLPIDELDVRIEQIVGAMPAPRPTRRQRTPPVSKRSRPQR
jgi:hypothetical protein